VTVLWCRVTWLYRSHTTLFFTVTAQRSLLPPVGLKENCTHTHTHTLELCFFLSRLWIIHPSVVLLMFSPSLQGSTSGTEALLAHTHTHTHTLFCRWRCVWDSHEVSWLTRSSTAQKHTHNEQN